MPGTTPQAERLRSDLRQLFALAERDLRSAWRTFDSADAAKRTLESMLPQLVQVYGAAAATLAADWYDEVRAEDQVAGTFAAVPARIPDPGADAFAGWAVGPLFGADPSPQSALTMAIGGSQRRIANASRLTVTGSSLADPQAVGWERVGDGSCAFCAMLLGRGAVYSEESADFAVHDHCQCSAVPVFGGLPRPVRPFAPSNRDITPADRARVRDYLRTH